MNSGFTSYWFRDFRQVTFYIAGFSSLQQEKLEALHWKTDVKFLKEESTSKILGKWSERIVTLGTKLLKSIHLMGLEKFMKKCVL